MTGPSRSALPQAARPFVRFCRVLHDNGFAVAGGRTIDFLKAIALLGPRTVSDIYWAARATLGPDVERIGLFDSLFNAAFRGDFGTIPSAKSIGGEESVVADAGGGTLEPIVAEKTGESGASASAAELLAVKSFGSPSRNRRLDTMRRRLGRCMPLRRSRRHAPSASGKSLDLRRSLTRMVRGGTLDSLPAWTVRQAKPRRVLLLIDISGSMKTHTNDHLLIAHTLTHILPSVETFSFGTRLTRLTAGLRHKDIDRTLREVSDAVADWDGGTRIADSINAFLSVPHYSRFSRGGLVVVLSDGLERGDPQPMVQAVRRLAARSWRLAWLTPLAADPDFRPETAALSAIATIVDHLGDGSGIASVCHFMEQSTRLGRKPPAP